MTEPTPIADAANVADLRAASDLFMQRLDRLFELETRKRELPPGRPEFVRLAREIEDLSRSLLGTSGMQVDLAEAAAAAAKRGRPASDEALRDIPPRRDAVSILAEWRAAERRLAAAREGSDEERTVREEVERLRAEYGRLTTPKLEPPA